MQVNLPKMKLQYRQELEEALTSMGESFMKTEGKKSEQLMGSTLVTLYSAACTD